jgi:hypothetical protein
MKGIDEIPVEIRKKNICILKKFTQNPDIYWFLQQIQFFFFIIYYFRTYKILKIIAIKFFSILFLLQKLCFSMEINTTIQNNLPSDMDVDLLAPTSIDISSFDILMKAATSESSFTDEWDVTTISGNCSSGASIMDLANIEADSLMGTGDIELEDGEFQLTKLNSVPSSSNKRANTKQGGRGGRHNVLSPSPTKARKIIINSFEKPPQEFINVGNRTILSEPQWINDKVRYQGNEEHLITLSKIEDHTDLIHDCKSKEEAYHQLVVENYHLPLKEHGFTSTFRTAALNILFPLLDITQSEHWGACMSFLILRIAGFDIKASHPLLPDMTLAIDTTNKGSYIHYRLSCLNDDIAPLSISEWKDMPGNARARQTLNFSIWSAYDSRNDTSHIEYERVLHRLKFIHPSNTSYSLWNINANINRGKALCEQVHNCRNSWFIIIDEYKNIANEKKFVE